MKKTKALPAELPTGSAPVQAPRPTTHFVPAPTQLGRASTDPHSLIVHLRLLPHHRRMVAALVDANHHPPPQRAH